MGVRTQITLTREQHQRLKRESERTGVSMAELIRKALDRAYAPALEERLRALEQAVGAWPGSPAGAGYVEALRPGYGARMKALWD